ncbi:MAG: hypothetical protein IPK44_01440 [Candidatus Accumulibacter sp.]|uniref:hypothetical protein n=1 Tax=Accumulibacter sp. TaxID=2053492 RepID=UPI0025910677|nr:hypothetical protein [Accumulibacter sp.]MBK8113263.1 hypothetical protein [Accumulibacter sp.]
MTETQLDAQKRKEAKARYDNINRRIAAVDRDIATETDGERQTALQEKRDSLARDREGAAAELTALDRRGNGDLEILQRKVSELGQALVSDNPAEAHAIINECAAALARLDTRVMGLEGRVTAIERQINPPWEVVALRIAAAFTVLLALFVGIWQLEVLLTYPIIGVILEGALISLAAATLFFANAKLQERPR